MDDNEKLFPGATEADYAYHIFDAYATERFAREKLFRQVTHIINRGLFERAGLLLGLIAEDEDYAEYLDMVEYLNGVLEEKKAFAGLDEAAKSDFISKQKKAKNAYENKRYGFALKLYEELKQQYGLVICDYYIGKILLRQDKLDEAREAFLRYLGQGGNKSEKAYEFLGRIEKKNNNYEAAYEYFRKTNRITDILGKPSFRPRKNQNVVSFEKASSAARSMIDFGSTVSVEEAVANYYQSDLSGKLFFIKGLLQSGRREVAGDLLRELERECGANEKGKVAQFRKLVPLYSMQGKRGTQG